MDETNIRERVKTYILEAVHVEKEKIKEDSLIFKEGFIDSMGFMTLITFLEEEFDIQTGDSDLLEENFESINAITEFVIRKMAA
jgi:acyl carrier protein